MKRQLLYLLAAFLIPSFCWGQWKQAEIPPSYRRKVPTTKIDDAQVTVYYAFNAKDIKDESTYIDLGWLQVGKQYTKYASYFVAHSDSTHQPKLIKNGAASGYAPQDFGGRYPNYWSEYQFDEIYIKDGQLTEYAFMPANLEKECCQYTETCPTQQWTLSDETKTIQGYMCQRATCHWRGRDYEAWFTQEVPIRRGPWKFGGLPGLIVNISDSKMEYTFELVRLERTPCPILTHDFSHFRKVSRDHMLKLQKKININWVRVLSPEAGLQIKDKKYNPLELE